MTFGIWEWMRIIAYVISLPAACYLAFRFARHGDALLAMLLAGLACIFGWYLFDLTLISAGLSSRETRNFATPLTVFTAGSLVALSMREMRLHGAEKRLRRLQANVSTGDDSRGSYADGH